MARGGRVPVPPPCRGFDPRRARMNPSPAGPPRMSGSHSLDQHRTGWLLDPYSRLSVQCSEWEASREKCICIWLIEPTRLPGLAIVYFQFEYLWGVRLIFPLDGGRDYSHIRHSYGQIANNHQKLVQAGPHTNSRLLPVHQPTHPRTSHNKITRASVKKASRSKSEGGGLGNLVTQSSTSALANRSGWDAAIR
jgi:hypothetical protein